MEDIRVQFKNPDMEVRGTPFWAWNCRLDQEELKDQIPYFKEMGMGGFIIHSRTGLDTPYLGEEFMEAVHACIEKARAEGLKVHLYDEDRWPSGYAGGYVTKNMDYRARCLVFSRWPSGRMPEEIAYHRNGRLDIRPNGSGKLIHCFQIELEDGYLKSYHILDGERQGEDIWYLHEQVMEPDAWFNGQTYMDTLNPKAVERFLETTYVRYQEALAQEFGTSVTSIFTDEPQFIHKHFFSQDDGEKWMVLPYTDAFEELFFSTYHTSFLRRIPELAWDRKDQEDYTVRYGYHRLLLERFASTYCDTLGKWCMNHGISLTGHMKGEGTLALQAGSLGEAMRNYRYFQIPGIDILCDKREFATAKQAQSAARQMGRKEVASELYGVTGWDFDFRGHKLQGDWQAALGITRRVHHLAWASMEGEAKRDFPASIFYQSPWYREYGLLETYFARIATVMKMGKPVVRLGVIHPIESFWLFYGAERNAAENQEKQETQFQEVIRWLLFGTVDFDFISEALLEYENTSCCDGRICVGEMEYEAILIPGLIHLRGSTIKLLKEFEQSGGRLLLMGQIPEYIDGKRNPMRSSEMEWTDKIRRIGFGRSELLNALEDIRDVEITDEKGKVAERYIYQMRVCEKGRFLFLANGTPPEDNPAPLTPCPLTIYVRGLYSAECWNPFDGSMEALKVRHIMRKGRKMTCIRKSLYEHDSLLLYLKETSDADNSCFIPDQRFRNCQNAELRLRSVTLQEENVLILDKAKFRLDKEAAGEEEEILRIENIVRRWLGFPLKGECFAQPWTERVKEKSVDSQRHYVELEYRIWSETISENVILAIEEPSEKEIWWNGKRIEKEDVGFYVDRSIRKLRLGELKEGDNCLIVRQAFTGRSNLECCFLLGEFGVRLEGESAVLIDKPDAVSYGNITVQGFPFYGGNLEYHLELQAEAGEYILEIPEFCAPLLAVELDGRRVGEIAFAPYRVYLGKLYGRHTITVICFGNRHNTFGALHNCKDGENWFGPSAWRTEGAEFTYGYQVRHVGIMKAPFLREVL